MGGLISYSLFFANTMGKIILYIFLLQYLTFYGQTDKTAYGFHGKVKQVTYYIYNDCPQDSTQLWNEDLCPLSAIRTMYFDKNGNIVKSIDEVYTNGIKEKFQTEYNLVNNHLKSSIRYRFGTNDVLEEVKYKWAIDKRHCSFKGIGLTTFSEGTRMLNIRNREIGGSYSTRTKKGRVLLDESYINEIDSFEILIKTKYLNQDKGDYTILYTYKNFDENKNALEVILKFEETKKIQRFIKKEFEYYTDEELKK